MKLSDEFRALVDDYTSYADNPGMRLDANETWGFIAEFAFENADLIETLLEEHEDAAESE